MKRVKRIGALAVSLFLSGITNAHAQFNSGGINNDEVNNSLQRTMDWLQGTAIAIIGIYLILNLIKLARDDEDGARAKKNIFMGAAGMGGVLLIRAIIDIVKQLTGTM